MALGSFSWVNRDLTRDSVATYAYLGVSINDKCNLSCPTCMLRDWNLSGDGVSQELLEQRLKEAGEIEDILKIPLKYVSISGKEPTTTPEKLIAVSKASVSEGRKIIVMTNSILLNPELQHKIEGIVDYFDPSFDVAGPKGIDEVIRKNAMFAQSWRNIKYAAKNKIFEKIGIISTINSQSHNSLNGLIEFIEQEMGDNERVKMSINFHVGLPNDPCMLNESQFMDTIKKTIGNEYKTRIIISLAYSNFFPKLFNELNIDASTKRYCSETGLASYDINGHWLIPFVHLETPVYGLRLEYDGDVYFGCSHMMFPGKTNQWSLGNIKQGSLKDILERAIKGKNDVFNDMHYVEPACADNDCYEFCRAGDRIAGLLYQGKAVDPFCTLIK
ncbi:MAG: radical SAM protein [Nanoarchaeota archaeon]|nr:radical SAM protein [Nanoarchaeota archaeon]MBU4456881.1 radical SAM protein [Nanoarchaeota archaeon]MCG2719848.1 radical SAM protein [Nanoarchaeota archaeon]